MYLNNLFVYGTLLPGQDNHRRFVEKYQPKVSAARAKGIMYHLPEDGYPVVVEGSGEVNGVLFETRELAVILPELDEIEKYTGVESQSDLIREIRDVQNLDTGETVKAHMFLWPPSRREWLEKNGEIVPDGDWKKFLAAQKK